MKNITCVEIKQLIKGRYSARPLSHDDRISGVDRVLLTDDRELNLYSDSGQSPPKAGWRLLLSEGDPVAGYRWTLFGISLGG